MSVPFDDLEFMARAICEQRNGPGSWSKPRRKRAAYRAIAQREIERAHAQVTADAFMAVFGMRRVAK